MATNNGRPSHPGTRRDRRGRGSATAAPHGATAPLAGSWQQRAIHAESAAARGGLSAPLVTVGGRAHHLSVDPCRCADGAYRVVEHSKRGRRVGRAQSAGCTGGSGPPRAHKDGRCHNAPPDRRRGAQTPVTIVPAPTTSVPMAGVSLLARTAPPRCSGARAVARLHTAYARLERLERAAGYRRRLWPPTPASITSASTPAVVRTARAVWVRRASGIRPWNPANRLSQRATINAKCALTRVFRSEPTAHPFELHTRSATHQANQLEP